MELDIAFDETSPEFMRPIWDRRAVQLARVPPEEKEGEQDPKNFIEYPRTIVIEPSISRPRIEFEGEAQGCDHDQRQDNPVVRGRPFHLRSKKTRRNRMSPDRYRPCSG